MTFENGLATIDRKKHMAKHAQSNKECKDKGSCKDKGTMVE